MIRLDVERKLVTLADGRGQLGLRLSYDGRCVLDRVTVRGREVAAESGYFGKREKVQTTRAFQWQAMIWDSKDEAFDVSNQTGNMYTINKIINEVMGSEGSEEQRNLLFRHCSQYKQRHPSIGYCT